MLVHVCVRRADDDQNVLLLPTVTGNGSLALTLTSSQLVHTSLPRTRKHTCHCHTCHTTVTVTGATTFRQSVC